MTATIAVDGLVFRDLDHDGRLAPYEDWRRPVAERVADLVSRLTLAEKAGVVCHGTLRAGDGPLAMLGRGTCYDLDAAEERVLGRGVSSATTRLVADPAALAGQNNRIQELAARGRLGIPVTISSDPRHHVGELFGASIEATGFTVWPGTLGLAAIGDRDTVARFGACVGTELRAVGIHLALAPQADLGTSQRWPRFAGTFGDDPELVRSLVGAFVVGAQGGTDGPRPGSVACVVKHWVGYGAARDGFDGHNSYGRFSAFPSGAFADHVLAFRDAIEAGVAGVMPTYNILAGLELNGREVEQVGAGFSPELIDGLLRRDSGFDGFVLSDWAITRDADSSCLTGEPPQGPDGIAMCWGVENLSRVERFARAVNAGVDQIGGEDDPTPIVEAVERGLLDEDRLDTAVGRVLALKFRLGLFEEPLVDAGSAPATVGAPAVRADALDAQRRSLVVVTAERRPPLDPDEVVFADGDLAAALRARGTTTTPEPGAATRAVARTATPHEVLHPGFFFGRLQHEGDTAFDPTGAEWRRLDALMAAVPTIVVITMDRPAVVTPFLGRAEAVIADLGVGVEALADVLVGRAVATGRLPFVLFRSAADVAASPGDRPAGPFLFPRGHRADPAGR